MIWYKNNLEFQKIDALMNDVSKVALAEYLSPPPINSSDQQWVNI